jgi:hypothetical protein
MVMLEKKVGAILIPKLRAILLKEADNNMHDGHVFGGCMMERARDIGLIPQEQLAEKERTAEDMVFGSRFSKQIMLVFVGRHCASSLQMLQIAMTWSIISFLLFYYEPLALLGDQLSACY